MKIIADFHIHSKYSRATSPNMDLEHFSEVAKIKGINVLSTSDFTHPEWFQNLKEKLEPAEEGLYRLKDKKNGVRFVVAGEISNMYTRHGRGRRIHNLIILPSLESAEKINNILSWQGNLKSDGRPILGMDSEELLKIVIDTEPNALFVPAHCMTPYFGIFGSMSGFDSLEEAFGENAKHIYAMETGLSASPDMLWRMADGRKMALISNSDAHSLRNLGREVNVFDTELSYTAIRDAIIKKDKSKFLYTIEFFPQEGKYYYDGHRSCGVSMSPKQREKVKGICPKCGRKLTIGVLSRVDELADRKDGFRPSDAIPYKSLVPLKEIIAESVGVGPKTKKVEGYYQELIQKFSNEFNILLDVPFKELNKFTLPKIAEGIKRVRSGKLIIDPGYDGKFGKVKIFQEEEKEEEQDKLF